MHNTRTKIRDTFLSVFPPPHILSMTAPGLSLSNSNARVIEVSSTFWGKKLSRFNTWEMPDGAVQGGTVSDRNSLIKFLSNVRQTCGIDHVHVSLPEEKGYLFHTHVPTTATPDQIRTTVEFKLEENVPIAPQDAIFDYDILGRHKNSTVHVDVSVAVYPKHVISDFWDVFNHAGMIPLSFESEAHSISRAVIPRGDLRTYMVASIGKTETDLFIVHRGALAFTSTLEIGGKTITRAIEKNLSISNKRADECKYTDGLVNGKDGSALSGSIISTVSALKDEINKHYTYWHTRRDDAGHEVHPVEKLLLVGSEACIPGLAEYFSAGLKVPTDRADVWTNMFSLNDVIPAIPREESYAYAPAVGLALRNSC